jgi:hypothetical protein
MLNHCINKRAIIGTALSFFLSRLKNFQAHHTASDNLSPIHQILLMGLQRSGMSPMHAAARLIAAFEFA